MTFGPIEINSESDNDELIFGPALVRSYELESTVARFPRIVIDSEVIRRASSIQGAVFYKQLVRRGEDGVYFVDYLCACGDFSERGPLVSGSLSFINHKRMIETQLSKLKSRNAPEEVIRKLLWLANYHNLSVRRLSPPEESPIIFDTDEEESYFATAEDPERLYISEELLTY
jgi:hypothetical protein